MRRRMLAGILLAAALATSAKAQDAPRPVRQTRVQAFRTLLPGPSTTKHTLSLANGKLDYAVTAGTLPLRDGTGARTAEIFHVAFTAEPDRSHPPADLPVQRRARGRLGLPDAWRRRAADGWRSARTAAFSPPPSRLVDNPDTWLRFTDLVFVDPVGTGYSRSALDEKETDRRFFGVRQDAAAMAAFIRLYLARERAHAVAHLPGRRELWRVSRGNSQSHAAGRGGSCPERHRADLAGARLRAAARRRPLAAALGGRSPVLRGRASGAQRRGRGQRSQRGWWRSSGGRSATIW